MAVSAAIDREKAEQFVKHTGQQVTAAMNCYVTYVGMQLGLYETLAEMGSATSDELAQESNLHERWIREWLRHQVANGQLEYIESSDRFLISPEAVAVLCTRDNPFYFGSGYEAVSVMRGAVDKLPDVFKTGLGLSYDDHGAGCACNVESLNSFVPKNLLVPKILPLLEGVCERLTEGIRVADVGCGSGVALLEMARAFPRSTFVGYDVSKHALERASTHLEESGLSNASFQNPDEEPLPRDHSFDFITTFDVVHDVPFPDVLIQDIYESLHTDGTWLCSDIRSLPTFAENLANNPSTAMMYGFSLMVCMSSAMSKPGGMGLGTLGFNEQVAREMTAEAGFTQFRTLEYENAMNNYYEIKP